MPAFKREPKKRTPGGSIVDDFIAGGAAAQVDPPEPSPPSAASEAPIPEPASPEPGPKAPQPDEVPSAKPAAAKRPKAKKPRSRAAAPAKAPEPDPSVDLDSQKVAISVRVPVDLRDRVDALCRVVAGYDRSKVLVLGAAELLLRLEAEYESQTGKPVPPIEKIRL